MRFDELKGTISQLTKEIDKTSISRNFSVKSLIEKASSEELITYAKLAEQVEQFEDMSKFLQPVADKPEIMKTENRTLLSVAYKNRIGYLRSGFRILTSIEDKQQYDKDLIKKYKSKVVENINEITKEAISLVDSHIYKFANSAEENVFFLKMKADCYRNSAECLKGEELKKAVEQSDTSYNRGMEYAKSLNPTNPIRLALELNYSEMKFELENNRKEAKAIAKKAFDDALGSLDCLEECNYYETTSIMQLIRDNQMIWTEDE